MKSLPYKIMAWLVAMWVLLAIFNCLLRVVGVTTDVPVSHFPISLFYGPTLHIWGIPYILGFLVLVFLALNYIQNLGVLGIWLVGLALILLGNLAQGSVHDAFLYPFYDGSEQYYHDAIEIENGTAWLSDFNDNQENLRIHARTHPPFAVLIHYWLLDDAGGALWISAVFVAVSSLSIMLVWYMMRICGLSKKRASLFSLLFAVIPAFNIYSVVCLDAVICTFFTLYLYGVLRIINKSPDIVGVICVVAGGLFALLLTFSGTFLSALGVIVAGMELTMRRKWGLTLVVGSAMILQVMVCLLLDWQWEYNYLASFVTSSRLENPEGFRAIASFPAYFMTRIEGLSEIALFFSLGCLAILFSKDNMRVRLFDIQNKHSVIFIAGFVVLLTMFATGAFRTGETARVCLFFYPFLLLAIRNVSKHVLVSLIVVASFQTSLMQVIAGYHW